MTLSQILPQLLKTNPVTLKEAPKNPNTTTPNYHPNSRCAYHSESPGHDTNNCWALKNKIQDLIEAKEIEFDAPEKPNVISAPKPRHGHNANAIEEDLFVTTVDELVTHLPIIKVNLLKVGVFSGCNEVCHLCLSSRTACPLLKIGIQCLIDNKEILFECTHVSPVSVEDISIITISSNSSRVSKKPVRITLVPKVTPLIITMPGPVPYESDKAILWNYDGDIYYHGIKQDGLAAEEMSSEKEDSDISNIVGTSKITRSGRIFSPEIAPPKAVFGPVAVPKVTYIPIIIS
ncbi:unnamed protein product [Vicia faba]|uniref:Uncharacterized protein n=1 Tax=Vicia faba TaxID=3906 RepID=A0AAV1AI95_VICFA|nr:unnamed protein product [Vicia faba]